MTDASIPAAPHAALRPRGAIVLAVVFVLLAGNAWAQVVLVPFGRTDDPPALTALQAIVGATALAAAWGSWRVARWAPAAALLHALATAGMLLSLGPLLDLPADARGGIHWGAGGILLLGACAAWYMRRAVRRRPA
jgi:hypothetical protein